uniref:Serum response factor-binding protein 1 n=1 Tax=Leptobrachium leishanense TaxID=445787 RepID=A0A8C5MIC7_9ANUR
MEPVLNLNNEVVKMRKDVKKVKVLTIRKLTRHIAKLKAKKGTEELLAKNQRRVQRLLEEIHSIKELKPDIVTKTALRKEINFDKVFKQPNSDAEDRAVARLATNPLMKHKIAALKEAIKAFKDARRNLPEEDEDNKEAPQSQARSAQNKGSINDQEAPQNQPVSAQNKGSNDNKKAPQSQPVSVQNKGSKDDKKAPQCQPVSVQNKGSKGGSKSNEGKSTPKRKAEDQKQDENKADSLDAQWCKKPPVEVDCSSEGPSAQSPLKAHTSINKTADKSETIERIPEVIKSMPAKKALMLEANCDSSDIDDSDKEDKEYFDDSTEERFLKQSSGFEDSESDGEDDFFIGKVRQTKKKKSDRKCNEQVSKEKSKPDTAVLDIQGSLVPKTGKLQSVFCNSLSHTKQKSSYVKREANVASAQNRKPVFPQSNNLKKTMPSRGPAAKSRSKLQESRESLHPSWEASRRRKEQQSQITAFQGKRIVFDD